MNFPFGRKISTFLTEIFILNILAHILLMDITTFSQQGQKANPLLPLEVSLIRTVSIFSFSLSDTLCTYSEVGRIAYFELIFAFFLEERTEGLKVGAVFFYEQ